MASKEREYIERHRRMFRSPVELHEDVCARYGADAAQKMSYREARKVYEECIGWAIWHNLAMQDYWAFQCGFSYQWDEENPKPIIEKVCATLKAAAEHLSHGQRLGLSRLEQQTVDTLWGFVPHYYPENYVACAREVSEAIVSLLPPETEERTEDGFEAYYAAVIAEVKQLTAKHDVDFDTSDFNLSFGYFHEWLSDEYGLIFDDAWERES